MGQELGKTIEIFGQMTQSCDVTKPSEVSDANNFNGHPGPSNNCNSLPSQNKNKDLRNSSQSNKEELTRSVDKLNRAPVAADACSKTGPIRPTVDSQLGPRYQKLGRGRGNVHLTNCNFSERNSQCSKQTTKEICGLRWNGDKIHDPVQSSKRSHDRIQQEPLVRRHSSEAPTEEPLKKSRRVSTSRSTPNIPDTRKTTQRLQIDSHNRRFCSSTSERTSYSATDHRCYSPRRQHFKGEVRETGSRRAHESNENRRNRNRYTDISEMHETNRYNRYREPYSEQRYGHHYRLSYSECQTDEKNRSINGRRSSTDEQYEWRYCDSYRQNHGRKDTTDNRRIKERRTRNYCDMTYPVVSPRDRDIAPQPSRQSWRRDCSRRDSVSPLKYNNRTNRYFRQHSASARSSSSSGTKISSRSDSESKSEDKLSSSTVFCKRLGQMRSKTQLELHELKRVAVTDFNRRTTVEKGVKMKMSMNLTSTSTDRKTFSKQNFLSQSQNQDGKAVTDVEKHCGKRNLSKNSISNDSIPISEASKRQKYDSGKSNRNSVMSLKNPAPKCNDLKCIRIDTDVADLTSESKCCPTKVTNTISDVDKNSDLLLSFSKNQSSCPSEQPEQSSSSSTVDEDSTEHANSVSSAAQNSVFSHVFSAIVVGDSTSHHGSSFDTSCLPLEPPDPPESLLRYLASNFSDKELTRLNEVFGLRTLTREAEQSFGSSFDLDICQSSHQSPARSAGCQSGFSDVQDETKYGISPGTSSSLEGRLSSSVGHSVGDLVPISPSFLVPQRTEEELSSTDAPSPRSDELLSFSPPSVHSQHSNKTAEDSKARGDKPVAKSQKSIRVEQIAKAVKEVVQPLFTQKTLTKDQYKQVMRIVVLKLLRNKDLDDPVSKDAIEALVKLSVSNAVPTTRLNDSSARKPSVHSDSR